MAAHTNKTLKWHRPEQCNFSERTILMLTERTCHFKVMNLKKGPILALGYDSL